MEPQPANLNGWITDFGADFDVPGLFTDQPDALYLSGCPCHGTKAQLPMLAFQVGESMAILACDQPKRLQPGTRFGLGLYIPVGTDRIILQIPREWAVSLASFLLAGGIGALYETDDAEVALALWKMLRSELVEATERAQQ